MRRAFLSAMALLGVWTFSFSAPWLNPGGFGDLLVFPYYNARGSRLTYVRFANVSDMTVVAKVRLREGMESRELADFVVCLSPHDQFSFWIANPELFGYNSDMVVIVRGGNGVGIMGDSDTVSLPGNWRIIDTYNAPNSGVEDPSRSFEGYVEVFGLRAYAADFGKALSPELCRELARAGFAGVKVNNGVFRPLDVPNVLMGEAYIFDAEAVYETYAYRAVAVSDFTVRVLPGYLEQERPTFEDADGGLRVFMQLFTKREIYAFFNFSDFYGSGTDLVLNFLTKKAYLDGVAAGRASVRGVFSGCTDEDFRGSKDYSSCCVSFGVTVYDDRENQLLDFSPASRRACYEVSYIPVFLRGSSRGELMDTKLSEASARIVIPREIVPEGFAKGWLKISFESPQPVVAYELQMFLHDGFSHMMPVFYDRGSEAPNYGNPFLNWVDP